MLINKLSKTIKMKRETNKKRFKFLKRRKGNLNDIFNKHLSRIFINLDVYY